MLFFVNNRSDFGELRAFGFSLLRPLESEFVSVYEGATSIKHHAVLVECRSLFISIRKESDAAGDVTDARERKSPWQKASMFSCC